MTTAVHAPLDLWNGLDSVPAGWGPSVVTIGVFDGVHRGHAGLIERTVEVARGHRVPTVMLTFDPHPARVVGPPRDTAALSTPRRRAELAGALGIDAVLVLPFTQELAQTEPPDFVRKVLVERLGACAVVVGANFRFGARGAGDMATLHRLGQQFGFTAEGVDLLHLADERCSSTQVRSDLSSGDVVAAAEALGRPHRVEGHLIEGRLKALPATAVPKPGRYRAVLTVSRRVHIVDVVVDRDAELLVEDPPPAPGADFATLDFLAPVGTALNLADTTQQPGCPEDCRQARCG